MYSTLGTHQSWSEPDWSAVLTPHLKLVLMTIRHRLLCVYFTSSHVTRFLPSMLTNETWSQTGGWNEADYCGQSLSHSTKFDIWLMWWYYLAVVFVSHKLHVVSCQHACTCVHMFTSLNCIAWGTILECKVCSILGSERDKYSIFMHCLATFEESNIHWGRTTTTLHTLEHRGRSVKLVQSVANVQLFSKLHPQNVN